MRPIADDTVLRGRTLVSVRKAIEVVRSLDLNICSDADLNKAVGKLLHGYMGPAYVSSTPDDEIVSPYGIYRARFCNQQTPFEEENEFWLPPSIVTKLGRCNEQGKPVLYCANHFSTAIIESRLKLGEKCVVTEYSLPTGNGIQTMELGFQKTPPNLWPKKDFYDGIHPNQIEKNELINAFLNPTFITSSANIPKIYRLTNAIVNFFFNQPTNAMRAIYYPSVALGGTKGANIIYHSDIARKFLRVRNAYFVQLQEADLESGELRVNFLGKGEYIDGKIHWKPFNDSPFDQT